MTTRDTILAAALQVLEEGGGGQFTTRAVCAVAKVSAPTLYHHFGSADGLLSATVMEAFRQFLQGKHAAIVSKNPETATRQGWDQYVSFAAARPRLYVPMMARMLEGARIDAAEQGYGELLRNIETINAVGRLAVSQQKAVDLIWASANAAALLHVTADIRKSPPPEQSVIERIREDAMRAILRSDAVDTGDGASDT